MVVSYSDQAGNGFFCRGLRSKDGGEGEIRTHHRLSRISWGPVVDQRRSRRNLFVPAGSSVINAGRESGPGFVRSFQGLGERLRQRLLATFHEMTIHVHGGRDAAVSQPTRRRRRILVVLEADAGVKMAEGVKRDVGGAHSSPQILQPPHHGGLGHLLTVGTGEDQVVGFDRFAPARPMIAQEIHRHIGQVDAAHALVGLGAVLHVALFFSS